MFRIAKVALLPILVYGIFVGPLFLWSQHPQLSPEEGERLILEEPNPVYPPLAMQARIQGTVRLEIVVSQTGTVESIKVNSGHPLLIGAALDAVKKRRYKPHTLEGQPTGFATIVEIPFSFGIPKDEYETQQQLRDTYFTEDGKCRDHLGKRQWADAEKSCKSAFEIADKLPDEEGLIKFMASANVGNAMFAQRRFQDAFPFYTRSLGYAQARAFLLLLYSITAVGKPGGGVVGGDGGDGLGDRLFERVHGAGLQGAEFLFHFAPAWLDGIEVG